MLPLEALSIAARSLASPKGALEATQLLRRWRAEVPKNEEAAADKEPSAEGEEEKTK